MHRMHTDKYYLCFIHKLEERNNMHLKIIIFKWIFCGYLDTFFFVSECWICCIYCSFVCFELVFFRYLIMIVVVVVVVVSFRCALCNG